MNAWSNAITAGCAALAGLFACISAANESSQPLSMEITKRPELFAPSIASTEASEVRLTVSRDGSVAAWFTRNRDGGAGAYDIWVSKHTSGRWSTPTPASFNSAQRDFDPAFSADGRSLYFCSDRPGGLGGDDIYRVAVTAEGFGRPEHLGAQVNSAGNEWAPMLSGDGSILLFSSDGRGGAGRFDLFSARHVASDMFTSASPLPGDINTAADEFDATFLADGSTVVLARAANLHTDRIVLTLATWRDGRYDTGVVLPEIVNAPGQNTYGPMLDWSRPDQLTISSQRPEAQKGGMDLYILRYRLK